MEPSLYYGLFHITKSKIPKIWKKGIQQNKHRSAQYFLISADIIIAFYVCESSVSVCEWRSSTHFLWVWSIWQQQNVYICYSNIKLPVWFAFSYRIFLSPNTQRTAAQQKQLQHLLQILTIAILTYANRKTTSDIPQPVHTVIFDFLNNKL